MSPEQQALKDQVAANTTVVNSARALIRGIADRIAAAGVDQAALTELTNSLRADDEGLAADVAANTVAATEPPAPPVEPPVGRHR